MNAQTQQRSPEAAGQPLGNGAPPARAADPAALEGAVARLVRLDPGFYAFSLAAETRWRGPVAGFAVPAVHVCAASDSDALEIVDGSGDAGAWLGGTRRVLLVRAPRGGAALLTAYVARDPDERPLVLEIRRVDAIDEAAPESLGRTGGALPPVATIRMGGPAGPQPGLPVSLEIVAHIRGRGNVRFADAAWAGRLGRGQWIEAFTIAPRDRAVAAAIEYKGLTASGAETPWIGCGLPCGTTGQSTPLLGFAVRQKALPDGTQLDCEYAGFFQSGGTVGPLRNGAPCRSPSDNDPLEGLQLRITPRPPRPAAAPA